MIYGGKISGGGNSGGSASSGVLQGLSGKINLDKDPNVFGDGAVMVGGATGNYSMLVSAADMYVYAHTGVEGDGIWIEGLSVRENGTSIYANPNDPYASIVINAPNDVVLYAGGGTKNPRSSFGYMTTLQPSGNTGPASSTAQGIEGNFVYDDNYLYLCVATDTWIRSPISKTW